MSFPPQQPGPPGCPRQGYPQQGYPQQGPHGSFWGGPAQPAYQQPPGTGYPPQGRFGGQISEWGPPPGPPPRKKHTGWIIGGVGAGMAVLLGVVLVVSLFVLGGDEIEAGDCIGSDEVAMNADIFVAECGSVRSSYRVVQVVEGPIGSPEGIFQRCGGSFWEKEPDRVLCITPDFAASDCLTTGGNPDAAPIKVACGDPRADLRVTEVKHVVPGEDVCGVLESYLGTRTPPLTACFTRVSAS